MNVPSIQFLGFCAVAGVLLALSRAPVWRRSVLLIANVGFFATFAPSFIAIVPFAVFLGAGYVAMRFVEKKKSRPAFAALLFAFVFGLCWLKRYTFFPEASLLSGLYVTVGLSYVFFRIVSVVVDAYQDVLPERVGAMAYINYTLNFTTLIAGPVQFYPQFHRDEANPAKMNVSAFARALERIVTGFFKVTVVSPVLLYAHQRTLALAAGSLTEPGRVIDAALILAIFPLYIYANFSGYTDAVIGAARFLGFELPENFNRPFLSRGYLEFWNRWHMSLSTWFKTYVYSPLLLGMMRRFPSRALEPLLGAIAYFVTFFLVGIWHGQTEMFVIFGFLNGAGVSGNKLYQLLAIRRLGRTRYQSLSNHPVYAAVSSGVTYLWLSLTLVFFWASWGQLTGLLGAFDARTVVLALIAVVVVAAIAYRAAMLFEGAAGAVREWRVSAYLKPVWYAGLATIVVSVAVILNAPAPHVVYKAF